MGRSARGSRGTRAQHGRSAQSGRGRGLVRRRTATSWRSTRLVEQPTEPVAPSDGVRRVRRRLGEWSEGCGLADGAVWPHRGDHPPRCAGALSMPAAGVKSFGRRLTCRSLVGWLWPATRLVPGGGVTGVAGVAVRPASRLCPVLRVNQKVVGGSALADRSQAVGVERNRSAELVAEPPQIAPAIGVGLGRGDLLGQCRQRGDAEVGREVAAVEAAKHAAVGQQRDAGEHTPLAVVAGDLQQGGGRDDAALAVPPRTSAPTG